MSITYIQPIQQGQAVDLFILYEQDHSGCRPTIERIFTHRVQAEAAMRLMRADSENGDTFWIRELRTEPHDNHR